MHREKLASESVKIRHKKKYIQRVSIDGEASLLGGNERFSQMHLYFHLGNTMKRRYVEGNSTAKQNLLESKLVSNVRI